MFTDSDNSNIAAVFCPILKCILCQLERSDIETKLFTTEEATILFNQSKKHHNLFNSVNYIFLNVTQIDENVRILMKLMFSELKYHEELQDCISTFFFKISYLKFSDKSLLCYLSIAELIAELDEEDLIQFKLKCLVEELVIDYFEKLLFPLMKNTFNEDNIRWCFKLLVSFLQPQKDSACCTAVIKNFCLNFCEDFQYFKALNRFLILVSHSIIHLALIRKQAEAGKEMEEEIIFHQEDESMTDNGGGIVNFLSWKFSIYDAFLWEVFRILSIFSSVSFDCAVLSYYTENFNVNYLKILQNSNLEYKTCTMVDSENNPNQKKFYSTVISLSVSFLFCDEVFFQERINSFYTESQIYAILTEFILGNEFVNLDYEVVLYLLHLYVSFEEKIFNKLEFRPMTYSKILSELEHTTKVKHLTTFQPEASLFSIWKCSEKSWSFKSISNLMTVEWIELLMKTNEDDGLDCILNNIVNVTITYSGAIDNILSTFSSSHSNGNIKMFYFKLFSKMISNKNYADETFRVPLLLGLCKIWISFIENDSDWKIVNLLLVEFLKGNFMDKIFNAEKKTLFQFFSSELKLDLSFLLKLMMRKLQLILDGDLVADEVEKAFNSVLGMLNFFNIYSSVEEGKEMVLKATSKNSMFTETLHKSFFVLEYHSALFPQIKVAAGMLLCLLVEDELLEKKQVKNYLQIEKIIYDLSKNLKTEWKLNSFVLNKILKASALKENNSLLNFIKNKNIEYFMEIFNSLRAVVFDTLKNPFGTESQGIVLTCIVDCMKILVDFLGELDPIAASFILNQKSNEFITTCIYDFWANYYTTECKDLRWNTSGFFDFILLFLQREAKFCSKIFYSINSNDCLIENFNLKALISILELNQSKQESSHKFKIFGSLISIFDSEINGEKIINKFSVMEKCKIKEVFNEVIKSTKESNEEAQQSNKFHWVNICENEDFFNQGLFILMEEITKVDLIPAMINLNSII
ncbi:hypothetical protein HK099_000439 [Clydaea vesicula]|uniref:Uncharacterized protein n=1 Tax=Clydaea vesicula TaxID=447962 RepID=A0AAD5UBR1_9FUNG|nr:hypothetical protein HK099_000439 [Clydaea vesicula]